MKMGSKGERKFRVVVKEKRSRRDGAAIDMIGYFEMGPKEKKQIDVDRYKYWISKGALPSERVAKIVQK